jgi:hypothetical protein
VHVHGDDSPTQYNLVWEGAIWWQRVCLFWSWEHIFRVWTSVGWVLSLERLVVREMKRFKQKQNDLILENQNPRMIVYFHTWFIVNWEQQYQLWYQLDMQIPYWSVNNKIHHISMQMETFLAKTIQLIQE